MKKQLLTAALMLTGMFALTPSVADAKSTMDSNLTLVWMNTDVAPLTLDVRQGFGRDGKFYLQNKAAKTIEVWNETGRIQEIQVLTLLSMMQETSSYVSAHFPILSTRISMN